MKRSHHRFAYGRAAAISSVVALTLVHCAAAATLPAGFVETQIAAGLNRPTAMALATDGRLFVCEQGGTLRVIKNGTLLSTPFVSLTVNSSGERGLLGVAFDPAFATNRFVYVYYTATIPNVHNRVSRFTAVGDITVAGSETVIMDLEPLGATNHNGGAIHFGMDGKLYVAVGENAVGANAQSLNNRLGKLLRINADGSIPTDNPFFTTATGVNRSIWAVGLRNPFTFAVQPLTGMIFINDVGQNNWEEINLAAAGANYGWPVNEGPFGDSRFRSPIYSYSHADGCAIAGGAFHYPLISPFPAFYFQAYFFADLCGGWIRTRRLDGSVSDFATGISAPVDLQFAFDGTLYYLARGSSATAGTVSRITYAVTAPKVDFTANGSDGPVFVAPTERLQLDLSFMAGGSGALDQAEMYISLITHNSGVLWLNPSGGFSPTPARVYAGRLADFTLTPWFAIDPASQLPRGLYWWFVVVDNDVDGVPAGDFTDFVVTVIN